MSPNLAMISDGKKFMWDGQLYDQQRGSSSARRSLIENESFEIQIVEARWKVSGVHQEDRQGRRDRNAVKQHSP